MTKDDLILFGDGLQALYYDEKNPIISRAGYYVKPILVVPSEELKSQYKLTEKDLNIETEDGKRAMWVEYPEKYIYDLRKSRRGSVSVVFCAYNQAKSPLMKYYEGLLELIKQQDIETQRLNMLIGTLNNELENAQSNLLEMARKNKELTDVYNESGSGEEED